MKYKAGDRVRIVSERVDGIAPDMCHWLGKVMTIKAVRGSLYDMVEDQHECVYGGWTWTDEMIEGLADETGEISVTLSKTHIKDLLNWTEGLGGESITRLKNALAELDAPKIGDRCAFWDVDIKSYVVGELTQIHEDASGFTRYYRNGFSGPWEYCAKIKKEAEF